MTGYGTGIEKSPGSYLIGVCRAQNKDRRDDHFDNVSCSQCGQSFGPGDSGYSHCADHTESSISITEMLIEFRQCLCAVSFTRAGHDFYDMAPAQKQSEAASGARGMARARQIWADNPDLHDDLRAVFKDLGPLAEMREIERAK